MQVAVWTLSVLCSTFHRNVDWVYHLYYENFEVLAQDGTLSRLLAAHPQLSADLVLPTLLTSSQLWGVMSKLFRGEQHLDAFVDGFFPNVLQTILLTRNLALYQALKVLKARISSRSNQFFPSSFPSSASSSFLSSAIATSAATAPSADDTGNGNGNGNGGGGGGKNDLHATLDKDPASVFRLLLRELALPG